MAGNVVTKPGVPAGLLVAGDSDGEDDQWPYDSYTRSSSSNSNSNSNTTKSSNLDGTSLVTEMSYVFARAHTHT